MLFVRTYHGMLGGHLKVFDYMHHVRALGAFEPVLYLTPNSTQSPREWLPSGTAILDRPVDAHAYFVAGFNWNLLDEAGVDLSGKPVVNLLQGLRHGIAGDPRTAFLSRPALRICVSPPVERAVRATGLANGPIATIRNGIDTAQLAAFGASARDPRVFIAGIKDPDAARQIAAALQSRGVPYDLCVESLPREPFLRRMAACRVALTLPDPHEGFFLPPLEAMAMGCAVVLPHCPGASSYCIDGQTCLSPPPGIEAAANAAALLHEDAALRERLRAGAADAVRRHSLENERAEFGAALRAYVSGFADGRAAG